jgi:hypothetical protein
MDWDYITAALSKIPATFWGVVIGSFFTSLGVWLTNRGVAKRFDRQLKHDRELRRDGREFALRREIYLAASDALAAGMIAISRFADMEIADGKVTSDYLEKAPAVARVHAVARVATIEAVENLNLELSAVYARLLVKRLPVRVLKTQLTALESSIATCGAEVARWVEMMKQENLQGRDDNRWTWIKRNFEFEQKRHQEAIDAQKALLPDVLKKQMDLLEECAKEHLAALSVVIPVLIAIRTELGLEADEMGLRTVLEASIRRQADLIAWLGAALREFNDTLISADRT